MLPCPAVQGAGLAAQGAGTSAAMTAAGGVGGRGAVSGSGAGGTSANGPASNSCYFLFLKQRDTITAFPVDMVYSFRPPPRYVSGGCERHALPGVPAAPASKTWVHAVSSAM
jgi:hypothetical protein